MSGHLDKFMKGWESSDLRLILDACANDFIYDDPYDGRMDKAEFAEYWEKLEDGQVEWSDEALQTYGGEQIHWVWWAWKPQGAGEWTHEGSALTKAGPDGVHSCRQAYYKGESMLPTE
jgi:hypothetical protein